MHYVLAFAHYETKGNPVANEVQIDPVHVVPVLKAFYALVIVGPVSYTLPKVSLLSLYLRIFTTRLFRSVAYVLMSIILVFWIVSFVSQKYLYDLRFDCISKLTRLDLYFCLGIQLLPSQVFLGTRVRDKERPLP